MLRLDSPEYSPVSILTSTISGNLNIFGQSVSFLSAVYPHKIDIISPLHPSVIFLGVRKFLCIVTRAPYSKFYEFRKIAILIS